MKEKESESAPALVSPPDWQEAIAQLVSDPRRPQVIMVVGAIDVGKSSFSTLLASALHQRGCKTFVIDTDMGQSAIGPPTTIGFGLVEGAITRLSQCRYMGGYFIGDTSPVGHMLAAVVGARLMLDRALRLSAEAVVVDTTGLVRGSVGRELKQRKLELLRPTHVVVLQRRQELSHLVSQWQRISWLRVVPLPAPSAAVEKSRDTRRNFRQSQFRALLARSQELVFDIKTLSLRNTWLGTGRTCPPNVRKHASDLLQTQVLHAEIIADTALVITDAPHDLRGENWLRSEWNVERLIITTPESFEGLVVGLLDEADELLQVGFIKRLDFYRRQLTILASPLPTQRVCTIIFGNIRVAPDGTELGRIPPGSI